MKAIILAAGEGIRMRPLTLEKPKPMLEILGRPILDYIFEALPDEVDEVIMVVGYKGDMISQYFGDEFRGRKISYVTQAQKLGTGHALMLCESYLNKKERFLVINADDLQSKEAIEKMLKHDLAVLTCQVADPRRFGVIVVDKGGKILDFEERPLQPKSNLVNVGVYLLDNLIFNYAVGVNQRLGECFLPDMIKAMMKDRDVFAEETSFWHPIGYPEDLVKAEKLLSKHD